ncbi:hypothetical protein [Nocardia altamirensis]|nr:hypothetical protein [Nocardia altamirensis]
MGSAAMDGVTLAASVVGTGGIVVVRGGPLEVARSLKLNGSGLFALTIRR